MDGPATEEEEEERNGSSACPDPKSEGIFPKCGGVYV
jgi:hypothetical protein